MGEMNQRAQETWNAIAVWWDEAMGEADSSHQYLIHPALETLLALTFGERVLEIACGNGNFARRLAQAGASVLACDFSEKFLERAKARTVNSPGNVEYRLIDATDPAQISTLGEHCFDAVVVSMGLQDMAEIEPLMGSLRRLLRAEGRFVFSITHPCFNSLGTQWIDRRGVLVTDYLEPAVGDLIGKPGQPKPHPFFHRPLWHLFGICFRAGLVLDGLLEPVPPVQVQTAEPEQWEHQTRIPYFLVTRWRLKQDVLL